MNSQRLSREEYKKSKELEELRKSGVAPAAVDEHGHMINPHIPEFISQQPWYSASNNDSINGPSLKHQYLASHNIANKQGVNDFHLKYQKGVKAAQLKQQGVVKFKPGSCENCGATTHKTKECCDRPRARNAKYTKTQLQPDEYIVPQINLSYAAKHDTYNNHDPEDYKRNIQKWQKTELHRKRKKLTDLQQELIKLKTQIEQTIIPNKPVSVESSDNQQAAPSDDTKPNTSVVSNDTKNEKTETPDEDSLDLLSDLNERKTLVEQKIAKLQRRIARAENPHYNNSNTNGDSDSESSLADEGGEIQSSTRDLRMREDTAKYLRNLDPNSAFYDPKTRSMRDNPYEGKNPNELLYAGDNFIRESGGGVAKIQELQKFVWDINKDTIANNPNAIPIHPQALPSASELLFKQARQQAEQQKKQQKQAIHQKYTQSKETNNTESNSNSNMADADDSLRNPLFDAVYKDGEINVLTTLLEPIDPESSLRTNKKSTNSNKATGSNQPTSYPGNHTSEFGSYTDSDSGKIGYACCKQTLKNSYCIGNLYEKELQRIKDSENSSNSNSNSNNSNSNTNSNEPIETEEDFNKKRKHDAGIHSEDSLHKRFASSVHD